MNIDHTDDNGTVGAPSLHAARAKYLTAYVLLSSATRQLERLAITRGAYKRTRRNIVRAAAVLMLAMGLLGLGAPRPSHATPVFAPPVANPFGVGPVLVGPGRFGSPEIADIDGDGDLDLFLGGFIDGGSYKYEATFFFPNVGTAAAPAFGIPSLNPFGLVPSYIAANVSGGYFHGGPELVDIDGDGDLDFFTQSAYLNGIDHFENVGTALAPAFAPAPLPPGMVGGLLEGNAQSFVDIDGDLDFDLFVGRTSYGDVFFQDNAGTPLAPSFAAGVVNPFGLVPPSTHSSPTFVDMDGDGDLDAFIGQYDGGLAVYTNVGTPLAPAFAPGVLNPFGFVPVAGAYRMNPELADIDDDGDVDLFTSGASLGYADLFLYENLEINCGDGIIDPSEVCDGAALGGETCETQGYDSGALACAPDCLSLDVSACVGEPCPPTPSGGCLAPAKAQFQLKSNANPDKQQLKFKWQKGAAFDHAMLGDPLTTTDTALCIYDETGGVPALVGRVGVPANAFWVDKNPKGFQFKDKTGVYDSVTKVQLKPKAAGKSSVALQAKGANLTLPLPISVTEYFDQDTNVTVQLQSGAGICWSADFTSAGTTKNDGVQFKAK